MLAKTGTLEQPFDFSTKRYDEQTGLIYYGYRFYGPSIARWTTRDPLGEAGGINLYAFVGNNPVNWVDPWGFKPGDTFNTMEAAVMDALAYIYCKSLKEDREYGGSIWRQRNPGGDLVYGYDNPRRGDQHSVYIPVKRGDVATFHSHGAESPKYDDENFSPADMRTSNEEGIPGYLVTPSGIIKVYYPDIHKVGYVAKKLEPCE